MDPTKNKESEIPENLSETNLTSNGKKEEKYPLKQIRTFQGDVAEALQKQRESLVSIQRAESFRRGTTEPETKTSSENFKKRKEFFMLFLGSFLFLVLGIVGSWYTYKEYVRKTATPNMTTVANRFIPANTEASIILTDLSRNDLINTLAEATNGVPPETLKHVVLKKVVDGQNQLISTSEFLNILKISAPGNLIRSFDQLFMFGAYGNSNFLIIKLSSFENAFAGMLLWEKNMGKDIGPLFTTSPLLRGTSVASLFSDITDKNKDIRVLKQEDNIVLLYSFMDNNTLIITDQLETMRTIVGRLTQMKLSR